MATVIDRSDLVDHLQAETVLTSYANGNEDVIARGVATGNSDVLAALRRSGQYPTAIMNGLTPATAPSVLKGIACAIAVDDITNGSAGRPPSISTALEAAKSRLSLIATGNYIVEDLSASTKGVSVSVSLPTARNDFSNPAGDAAWRDPIL